MLFRSCWRRYVMASPQKDTDHEEAQYQMRLSRFSVLLVSLTLLFAASGLHAQTFNLQTGRESVASLDGFWRFHIGDNPAWAEPNFDDSKWPLLRSDEAPGQQGYQNYSGFAWYRFTVAVPEGSTNWSIYLGPMETGYQLFVDGRFEIGRAHI